LSRRISCVRNTSYVVRCIYALQPRRAQVNDGHDTLIDYAASFLEYWLLPLLTDARFNGPETLILLTFDENETHTEQNRVWALAFGACLLSFLPSN
jgi:hypothetical protein